MNLTGRAVQSASLEARIIKADGRVIELGQLAYYHRNPFRRWAWHARRWAWHARRWALHARRRALALLRTLNLKE